MGPERWSPAGRTPPLPLRALAGWTHARAGRRRTGWVICLANILPTFNHHIGGARILYRRRTAPAPKRSVRRDLSCHSPANATRPFSCRQILVLVVGIEGHGTGPPRKRRRQVRPDLLEEQLVRVSRADPTTMRILGRRRGLVNLFDDRVPVAADPENELHIAHHPWPVER